MIASSAPLSSIDAREMLHHIQVLASDTFEGRAPASRGEVKTVEYLVDQFKKMGLRPGHPDGSYIQEVPLVGFRTEAEGTIARRRQDGPP